MKKTFGKAVYDTETAEVVRKCTWGYYGDPAGYEEILFRTPGGAYFAYGRGGEACVNCGRTLKQDKIAGRTTVYCPHCQPARKT